MRKNSYFEEEKKPWNYYTNDDVRRAFLRKKYGPIVDAYDMGASNKGSFRKGKVLFEQDDPLNIFMRQKLGPIIITISLIALLVGFFLRSSTIVTIALCCIIAFIIISIEHRGRRIRIYQNGVGFKIDLKRESFYVYDQIIAIYPFDSMDERGLKIELAPLLSVEGIYHHLSFQDDPHHEIMTLLRSRFGDRWDEIFHENEMLTNVYDIANPHYHIEKNVKKKY